MRNEYYDSDPDDERFTFRLDPNMKTWLKTQGGSKFLRRLCKIAYKQIEKKEFIPSTEED